MPLIVDESSKKGVLVLVGSIVLELPTPGGVGGVGVVVCVWLRILNSSISTIQMTGIMVAM